MAVWWRWGSLYWQGHVLGRESDTVTRHPITCGCRSDAERGADSARDDFSPLTTHAFWSSLAGAASGRRKREPGA